jgi:hypothetical protein
MIQNYIDMINAHNWTNEKLKSSLILATYTNYGLIEFSRSLGAELTIDIEGIINNLIAVDKP